MLGWGLCIGGEGGGGGSYKVKVKNVSSGVSGEGKM